LALTSLGYRDHFCGLSLPYFILNKLGLQRITLVAHDVELGGAKVGPGLDVLEAVEIGIILVQLVMSNLLVRWAFFHEGNNANRTPLMRV
jgi:hypothetical protein